MLRRFTPFERREVEPFRLSALLAFDQRLTDRFDFETTLLFAPDKKAICPLSYMSMFC